LTFQVIYVSIATGEVSEALEKGLFYSPTKSVAKCRTKKTNYLNHLKKTLDN